MKQNMVCDIYSGICTSSDDNTIETIYFNFDTPMLTFFYVTDPMCSHIK